jgi:hypothetical protein
VKLEGSLELRLVGENPPMESVAAALKGSPGPAKVRFRYHSPDGEDKVVRASSEWSVRLQAKLIDHLNDILGPENVRVVASTKRTKKAEKPKWQRAGN